MNPPEWWPDWTGETIVIVAAGPSAKDCDFSLVKGKAKVIAINRSWELVPWADILYGCDFRWWKSVCGCPEFKGLKLSQSVRGGDHPEWPRHPEWNVRRVTLFREDRLQMTPGTVGAGNNSGFQAFNLAVQFKPKSIVLCGYDMRVDHGVHWHGAYPEGMNNPSEFTTRRWVRSMDAAAATVSRLGIRVANVSSVSALKAYPKMSLAEAMGA